MKTLYDQPSFRFFLFLILGAPLFLSAFQGGQQIAGISIWVWLVIILLVVFVAWYLLRTSQASAPPTTELKPAPAPVEVVEDDLTLIEGIGPKIDQVFKSAGITSFRQLAETEVSRLEEILEQAEIRIADPGTWPKQARLAAEGDHEGLKALQDRLQGGREA